MDTQKETQKENEEKHEHHYWSGRCHGRWVLKIIFLLIIILVIFGAGIALGRLKGTIRGSGQGGYFGPKMMYRGAGKEGHFGMGRGWSNVPSQKLNQLFGVITKIEGSKITISDNGGQEQIILSTSQTRIFSKTEEIGLASLKVGQNISSAGALDKDNHLVAQMISIAGP